MLWRGGDHVNVKLLVEDFARYLYLPRLTDSSVLLAAVGDGIALMTWERDTFAFAEGFDDGAERYRGLRAGQRVSITDTEAPGLLVKSEAARKQLDAESATPASAGPGADIPGGGDSTGDAGGSPDVPGGAPAAALLTRFHGTVTLDSTRVGRDAGRIAEDVIAHLVGLEGSAVDVSLEIEAKIPSGTPDNVVRTVTENSRTLKFSSQGFETE